MANIYSLQLLRNGAAFSSRTDAYNALSANTANVHQDGVAVLARYTDDGKVKTLVGFYALASAMTDARSGESYMTIIDVEGAASDVQKLREEINAKLGAGIGSGASETVTAQLTALSGNSSSESGDTSVAGAKKYADEKISEATAALTASTVSGASKVVIDVTQTDGKITASAANLTGVKLDGYQEGSDADIAATDTLGEALGKLQAQINAMDLGVVSGDGEVITAVSEADGKVSASKTHVKDLQLGGYAKTNDTGDIASGDTINVALSKLENKSAAITIDNADGSINVTTAATGTDINVNIKSVEHVLAKDGNAGLYTNIQVSAVTGTELSNLGTNVKEAYKLVGTDNTKLGEYIKIYKDSSLYSAYLGHVDDTITSASDPTVVPGTGDTALCFIYLKTDGTYELVAVNVEEFIEENEFASGVTWDNVAKKVKGVVDSTSETFLTVGADGFKLSGVQTAINTAIEALDADVSGNSTHVTVGVEEVNGVITAVTVAESNIANATDLTELSGKTVTAITSNNSSITASISDSAGNKSYNIETDASKIKMSGFTADASGFTAITTANTVTEAVKAIETEFIANEQTVSSALTDLKTRLSAETAARKAVDGQSGNTYTANAGIPYISDATSLNDADIKLAQAISGLSGDYIEGVKVNNVQLAETNHNVNIQISAVNEAANSANAIVVNTNDSTGAVTLQLGTIDAGYYD